jgi:hypothetical protein
MMTVLEEGLKDNSIDNSLESIKNKKNKIQNKKDKLMDFDAVTRCRETILKKILML